MTDAEFRNAIRATLNAAAMEERILAMAADRSKMALAQDEIDRAWAIKEAVEADDTTQNLSDFDYVQYALTAEPTEPVQSILYRIKMMEAFREEYCITEEPQQAMMILHQYTHQYPGWFLAFDYVQEKEMYVTVLDWDKFVPGERTRTKEDLATTMAGVYNACQCATPNFQSMRNGDTVLIECEGIGTKQVDFEFSSTVTEQLIRWYPKRFGQVHFINSPAIVNMLMSTFHRIFPSTLQRNALLGEQVHGLEGIRLDQLYCQPNRNENLLNNLCEATLLRWKHRSEFVLPARPDPPVQR